MMLPIKGALFFFLIGNKQQPEVTQSFKRDKVKDKLFPQAVKDNSQSNNIQKCSF